MKILISGGGTAGHINPAIAIARYAISQNPDTKVLFIGTRKGLESTLVPREGFDIEFVDVEGLKKELSMKSAVSAAKLALATIKCFNIIRSFKPDFVIGTGGYVCVSSVLAAKMLKIPSLVHEQNVFPGSAVKFLATKCDYTAISFEESRKYLSNCRNIVLTGNPIRPSILKCDQNECKKRLGFAGKKLILAFGGSLGASRINEVVTEFISRNPDMDNTAVCFGTGKREYDSVMQKFNHLGIKTGENIIVTPYIDNMDVLMNAADLIICRSGAITLAEICAIGKSAILIPSPNVTNNHQEYNARALSDKGAAITITENEFNIDSLEKSVFSLLYDDAYRMKMSARARENGITDACEKIYNIMTNHI